MNFYSFKDEIAEEFGLTKELSRKIISYIQKRMYQKIIFGEEISFWLIGTLKLKVRQPFKFQNLQTRKIELSKKSYYLKLNVKESMKKRLKEKIVHGS